VHNVSLNHDKQLEDHAADIAVLGKACVKGGFRGGKGPDIGGPKIKSATKFLRNIAASLASFRRPQMAIKERQTVDRCVVYALFLIALLHDDICLPGFDACPGDIEGSGIGGSE
jgi:hypothetical protein